MSVSRLVLTGTIPQELAQGALVNVTLPYNRLSGTGCLLLNLHSEWRSSACLSIRMLLTDTCFLKRCCVLYKALYLIGQHPQPLRIFISTEINSQACNSPMTALCPLKRLVPQH